MDTTQQPPKARDVHLPDYFDMQARIGHTKHIGGWFSTQEMAELCHLGEGQELLYVGAGAGTAATRIVQVYGCRLVGIDLLESMVQSANEWAKRRGVKHLVDFRQGDAQDLAFEDNRFDVLFCESVNTFVPDLDRAASEYVRVVKPGGYVGLNEAIWVKEPSQTGRRLMKELTGQQLRRSEEWIGMLERAGLVDLVSHPYGMEMRTETRSQFGFLSLSDYLRILWKFLGSMISDPASRHLLRTAFSDPRELYEYMGYGIYVGRKPL
jgi:ubiquinone/menaquinone biosynthesis C-methylase UbiE